MRTVMFLPVLMQLSLLLPAADLIVDPGNPLAYPTIQAAMQAAAPGDRILLAAGGYSPEILVSKSVTIEPLGPGRVTLSYGFGGVMSIGGLTPGIPLILRRIDFRLYEMGTTYGIRTGSHVAGEVRMDDCTMFRGSQPWQSPGLIWGGQSML